MSKNDETPRPMKEDPPPTRSLSRREFLKIAGAAGAVVGVGGGMGGLLAGCGEEEQATTTAPPTTAPPAAEAPTTTAPPTTVGPEPPAQDKLVFGASRPISGPMAGHEENLFGPAYKMWVQDVNAAGGINVAGKKLPIELLVYDDKSDMDTAMRLLDRLMKEDRVDFLFAPAGTAFLFAAAAVTSAAGYLLMSSEGGATTLEAEMRAGKLPLYFQVLNYANHWQQPMLAQIMQELGIRRAAYAFVDDLHGIEYEAAARTYWGEADIEITSSTAIPRDVKDLTAVVRQMQAEDPDIVVSSQMPPGNILFMQTLLSLNYNPKAVLLGPGSPWRRTADIFGANMNGVMTFGAWSINSSPEAKAYEQRLIEFLGDPKPVCYWSALMFRGQLEFLQQAIEKAATLDHEKIAEVMRTSRFNTVLGETFFDDLQRLDKDAYPGQIGQWQDGTYEVIDVGPRRTAPPVYPKPAWGPVAPPAT